MTKCDEVAPPQVSLPTDNERKNRNILEEVQDFRAYLSERGGLRPHVNAVVPTVAYAEYQEGRNGLILPDEDYRWNITELIQTVIKCTPKEIRGSWARMAQLKEFQLTVANTVVNACAALAGFVSANPIPGSAIPAVGVLQTFMVMYIGWLGGHEFSEQTLKDFAIT